MKLYGIPRTQSLEEILSSADIRNVWADLGGGKLRHGRGQAFWRDGDGLNVALYPDTNSWHDFARGEGGGLLALIQRAEGGSRAGAAERLAEICSARLDRSPWSPARVAERHRAKRRRRQIVERRAAAANQLKAQAISALRSECIASAWARDNMGSYDELGWEAVWIAVQRGFEGERLLAAANAIDDAPGVS